MGPVPIVFFRKLIFGFFRKMSWLPGPLFNLFSVQLSKSLIFDVFDRDQQDARRNVMQIRGGITSGSALVDFFVAIEDVRFSLIFDGSSVFPVPGSPKKCTLIISVNRRTQY